MPPEVADILDIAAAAFIEDRRGKRGAVGESLFWRSLTLRVAVRSFAFWNSREARGAVQEVLTWLTGDEWNIEFERSGATPQPRQIRLPIDNPTDDVALFSGGLDATAGLGILLASGRTATAIGVVTNPAMRGYQRRVIVALQKAQGSRLVYSHMDFASLVSSGRDEPTRRTRALVFLGAGVAAAVSVGRDELLLFENGVGAVNLPYTAAQWGPMTSRSAHPKTLAMFADLVSLALGRVFKIRNPHVTQTKGQMCALLPEWARTACSLSQSCDNSAAGRSALDKRCGECTSCLLRRLSLTAANRSDWDPCKYRRDVLGPRTDRDRTVEMLWQAANLDEALRSGDARGLERRFPSLREVPRNVLSMAEQRRLFAEYVEEWRRYPDPRVAHFLAPIELKDADDVVG